MILTCIQGQEILLWSLENAELCLDMTKYCTSENELVSLSIPHFAKLQNYKYGLEDLSKRKQEALQS